MSSATPGQVCLGCRRSVAEQARGRKPVSHVPVWSRLELLLLFLSESRNKGFPFSKLLSVMVFIIAIEKENRAARYVGY